MLVAAGAGESPAGLGGSVQTTGIRKMARNHQYTLNHLPTAAYGCAYDQFLGLRRVHM